MEERAVPHSSWASLSHSSHLWLRAEAMREAMLHASRVTRLQAQAHGCPVTAYIYACDAVRFMRVYLDLLNDWRKEV